MTRRKDPEQMICEAFIARIPLMRPDMIDRVFHIPLGGKRFGGEGRKFKKMGTRAGMTDYFIMKQAGLYPGLLLEVKHETGPSPEQIKFISDARLEGYAAAVAWGIEETWFVFKRYLDGRHESIEMQLNTITRRDRQLWRKRHGKQLGGF